MATKAATAGDDLLIGTTFDDRIDGLAGDDLILGLAGADRLLGGAGNDTVSGGDGNDIIAGNAGDDTIDGGAGADTVDGGDGNDVLVGSEGSDTLAGGRGDDTFVVHGSRGDVVTISDRSGTDTLDFSLGSTGATIDLRAGATSQVDGRQIIIGGGTTSIPAAAIENALGTEFADTITGNDLANIIWALAGADTITAGAGNDTVYGGAGNDSLAGEAGDDTLLGGDGDDVIYGDPAAPPPADETTSNTGTIPATGQSLSISLTLPDATNATSVQASGFVSRSAVASSEVNIAIVVDISGSTGNDVVGSTNVGDQNGDGKSNTILDAEIAAVRGLVNAVVTDAGAGGAHVALIPFNSQSSIALQALANADADGNGEYDIVDAAKTLRSGGGTSFDVALQRTITYFQTRPSGGANYVYFLSDGVPDSGPYADESATLRDASGINATIKAFGVGTGSSERHLDLLDDGIDNNSAIIVTDPSTLGVDIVASPVTQAEIARVELYLNGSRVAIIPGSSLVSTPLGLRYDYTLTGLDPALADKVVARVVATDAAATRVQTGQSIETGAASGAAGNDMLDGGAGADTMVGGGGNDTYIVDNVGDVVEEEAGAGTDMVRTSLSAYTLGLNVENLAYTGSRNFTGTGNGLANTINGNVGNDRLYGSAGNDTLNGGRGNDWLDGGVGFDRLSGGSGNDTYVVDSSRDRVIENAGAGSDTVRTTLAAYTLGANVENLVYAGSGNFTGTGNSLANVITGNTGNDHLYGGIGNDTLNGGRGGDWLDGGAGYDLMSGGAGNDTYMVDSSRDRVVENAGAGRDLVRTSLSAYALGANVDNLAYTGSADFTGTGNSLVNVISGNVGNDRLYGGAGNDRLNGGGGRDRLQGDAGADSLYGGSSADLFVYADIGDSTRSAYDVIYDFSAASGDRVSLSLIDADGSSRAGNGTFRYVGSSAFSGAAGELRFSNGFLQGDVNGDRVADVQIQLAGVTSLSASSLIL